MYGGKQVVSGSVSAFVEPREGIISQALIYTISTYVIQASQQLNYAVVHPFSHNSPFSTPNPLPCSLYVHTTLFHFSNHISIP